ncbi:MAG: putative soluble quinoprotein glucose/sorbosone dehydrogenase [Betaproteobacteria bacterium]|nr:putative soluble quinoprotein glucose/sorbosone dehydrogenase [Betaproteobacteria bacterium]
MITALLARLQACALLLFVIPVCVGAAQLPLDKIKLPPGFEISVFADNVPNARAMALGEKGTVFVGSMRAGKVYAVRSRDGKATETLVVASGLNMPVGVTFHQGSLYVSAVDRILRLDKIEDNLARAPQPQVVTDRLPSDTHHGWKFISFGPDGLLYVPVGAPCNVCDPDSNRHANIMRMKADGSGLEVFARGVRNSVGFDWHPETRDLWFTDNGRDWLGDDKPDCELNHAPRKDMHFGFPFCHAGDISDPEFGHLRACTKFTPPAVKLGPHVAPLGMRFYTGNSFPAAYKNNIFIAEHGSWNRSRKSGYRVVRVVTAPGRQPVHEVFAEGWLQDQSAWGRPTDVLVMPDGALLVSDDQAGVIYRIAYKQSR